MEFDVERNPCLQVAGQAKAVDQHSQLRFDRTVGLHLPNYVWQDARFEDYAAVDQLLWISIE